jgi:hypothetical protein
MKMSKFVAGTSRLFKLRGIFNNLMGNGSGSGAQESDRCANAKAEEGAQALNHRRKNRYVQLHRPCPGTGSSSC